MTIAIGVLATEPSQPLIIPNVIILLADTMGSYGDEFSHGRLHKLFEISKSGLYVAAANSIDRASVLLPMIDEQVSRVPREKRTHGDIHKAIANGLFVYKTQRFILDVFPKYRLPPDFDLTPKDLEPGSLDERLQAEWEAFDIRCDLIIGAFSGNGQANLFDVRGENCAVEALNLPGFAAIGSGAANGEFWLAYRKHALSLSVRRAAYHAYEAKLMAEMSAHVNEHLDLMIATKDRYWNVSTHSKSNEKDCPVSLRDLAEMFQQYGPKETGDIRPSTAQTSAPEQ